jgi:ribose-phosphate pyrophosphokinase
LDIPYLPYSRQDRQCAEGEAFSLRTFVKALAPYLDGVGDRVYTWDVHSHVANELFRTEIGCEFNNLQPQLFLQKFKDQGIKFSSKTIVIAPDKGAVERATLVQQALGLHSVVYATKVRNPENGQILRTEVPENISYRGKNLLIVDDICDGGRTFIELAKVLRQFDPSRIDLYVTHGIFSKGFEVFEDLIDNFYVANLLPNRSFYNELSLNLTFLRNENYPTQPNQQ